MLLRNRTMINDVQAGQHPKGLYDSPKDHINHGGDDLCGVNVIKAFEHFSEIKWFI